MPYATIFMYSYEYRQYNSVISQTIPRLDVISATLKRGIDETS